MTTTLDAPPACTDAVTPLARLTTHDLQVPTTTGARVRYANLDLAASAPPLESVLRAVTEAAGRYSSIHRGAGWASQVSTTAYEAAKARLALFVGARSDDLTVITRNTTDALTLLAAATPGGVVHLDIEHHANLLPWRRPGRTGRRRCRAVPAGVSIASTLAALEAELAAAPAALVTVTGASNVTGELLPLPLLADLAHRHGARLAVDGAQLVPHRPVDVAAAGIDYLALSGHKLYAPFGAGALIGRADWLDAAAPHQPGGGAVRRVGLHDVQWATGPARHEGGTPNLLGAVALAAACDALADLGWEAIVDHERELTAELLRGLTGLGLEPLRIWPAEADDVLGIVSVTVPGVPADRAAALLAERHGIGVRDGRFCAHPLLDRFGEPAAVRTSLGVGSSSADVDALLTGLAELIGTAAVSTFSTEITGNAAGLCTPSPTNIRSTT